MHEQVSNFMAWLKTNDMTFEDGQVSYKGASVCYMHLDDGEEMPSPWTIWSDGDYSCIDDNVPMDECMLEIAWANVNDCAGDDCPGKCGAGKSKVIFGRTFENVCNADMAFYKPCAETLECVKKLLLIRKNDIDKTGGRS